eukprot:s4346_g7.t1
MSSVRLADINALSDDEDVPQPASSSNELPVVPAEIFAPRRRGCRKRTRRSLQTIPSREPLREQLLRIVQMKCRCAQKGRVASCFRGFRNNEPAILELVRVRVRLKEMHKQDADEEAWATFFFA